MLRLPNRHYINNHKEIQVTDFKMAFREGLTAAEKAEQAKKEINKVFEELNKQIKEISDNKIQIEIMNFQEKLDLNKLLKHPIPEIREYPAIAAFNPKIKSSPVKQLARWAQDNRGFPCKITWNGNTKYCEDKEALEQAISELLKDPVIGESNENLRTIIRKRHGKNYRKSYYKKFC